MARQPWDAQIRNARTPAEQTAVLRALKNDIIGHPLRKELAVASGVLPPVIHVASNPPGIRNDGKAHDHSFAAKPLNEDEVVRLQGLQIIASMALGGPSFLPPLYAASVLPAILSNLCPTRNPAQVVLASLRALSNLADSSLQCYHYATKPTNIAKEFFTRPHTATLCQILSQSSSTPTIQCQISIASALIGKLCWEESHRQILATSGVLDALAAKLAGHVVAEGLVIPGADILAHLDGLGDHFPKVTPSNISLAVIMEAISTIITNSKFRASQLLYSPAILAIFPVSQSTDFITSRHALATWNAFNIAGLSQRQSQLNAVDFLLPHVPYQQFKATTAQAAAFPPLGTSSTREHLGSSGRSVSSKYNTSTSWGNLGGIEGGVLTTEGSAPDSKDLESPLISYLILILRSKLGMERLMAASVLTVLYRAGLTNKTRERFIGLLVVPLLVNMLDDSLSSLNGKGNLADEEAQNTDWSIKERAPAVLSTLITDSEFLQKAAFDAGAIAKLAKILKVAYDPVTSMPGVHAWSPHSEDLKLGIEPFIMGHRGPPPLLVHKVKIRESTLKAIAALVPFKEEYRTAIVDQGIIPYIVESLNPTPTKPSPKASENDDRSANTFSEVEAKDGYGTNTVDVLVAACGAIRALSRSVSVLRTTLIDSGVAMPVFRLLKSPCMDVKIAATATVCNLVTDVSPMRDTIKDEGVLKILCSHAHSTDAKLRLNALWALKHFVHSVSNEVKRQCLDELGQGWLVQLICDDTEDEALLSSRVIGGGRSNSGHHDDIDEDVEMDQFDDNPASVLGTSARSNSRPSSSRSKSFQQVEVRLRELREAEMDLARKARNDDIAVQEQGLDFIRNLIGGAGQGGTKETTEMIDFLFITLGQDRVFDILASKLKPKAINPFNRRISSVEKPPLLPPQSEIITAVGYILVHMAASIPRHRQLVIAQTELLKLLVPHFNNSNIEVRLALCWLVTNLTWLDDADDGQPCAQRVVALKNLGFFTKLEMLEEDPELNVRERAKSALSQMKKAC
ncbi:armadillo-type protein [Amylocarpus encephaloides]|uniref:Armadillo-type protein n=1 Tax=Amylocarpus encephaloides TaxID=45428 RepID=A0A9P7YNV6_9HELO|nr:armadillo-type protein [Amylocarpus encephaloides]